jgi:hypothetical protein
MNDIFEKLKSDPMSYFDAIQDPLQREQMEILYQAFKARIMCETRVSGYSNMGVVQACLEDKPK